MGFNVRILGVLFCFNVALQCVSNMNISNLPSPRNLTDDLFSLDVEELSKALRGLTDINSDVIESLNKNIHLSLTQNKTKDPLSEDVEELAKALQGLIDVNNDVIKTLQAAEVHSSPFLLPKNILEMDWNLTEELDNLDNPRNSKYRTRYPNKENQMEIGYVEEDIKFEDLFTLPPPVKTFNKTAESNKGTVNRSKDEQDPTRKVDTERNMTKNESIISHGKSTTVNRKLHKRDITRPMDRENNEILRFSQRADDDNLDDLEEVLDESSEEIQEPDTKEALNAKSILPLIAMGKKIKAAFQQPYEQFKGLATNIYDKLKMMG